MAASAHAGRIMDFVESGKLVLTGVKFFVLDEADRLLDTGNQDTIMKLFGRFPKAGKGVARLQVHPSMIAVHPCQHKRFSHVIHRCMHSGEVCIFQR